MFPPRLFWVTIIEVVLAAVLGRALAARTADRRLNDRGAKTVLALLVPLHAVYFWALYLAGHDNFLNGAVDTATIAQSLWNIASGFRPYETILETHMLRVHFTPWWYLLSLVFAWHPSIPWLIWLSCFSVSAGAWFVYLLGRDRLESAGFGLALAVSFLLNPYLQFGQLAAAHAENFVLPWILASLVALNRRNWGAYALFAVLACLGKEDIGLYYAVLGVVLALGRGFRRVGVATAVPAVAYSLFVYLWWMPQFGPDTQDLINRFGHFGGTAREIAKTLILRPDRVALAMASWDKLFEIFYLLATTGFSLLAAGWAALPAAAAAALKSLTQYRGMYLFRDHYALTVMPFLYWGAVEGTAAVFAGRFPRPARWLLGPPGSGRVRAAAWFFGVLALLVNLERGMTPLSRKFDPSVFAVDSRNRLGEAMMRWLPPDASVLAQERLLPHVALRRRLHGALKEYAWYPGAEPRVLPEYAVFNRPGAETLPFGDRLLGTALFFRTHPDYELLVDLEGWELYRRRADAETPDPWPVRRRDYPPILWP